MTSALSAEEWPSPAGPSGLVKAGKTDAKSTAKIGTSSSSESALDVYQLSARKIREATKNKAYRAYPLGQEAGAYLRWKRGRLTEASYRDYESGLDKLARFFPDLEITDFEPPVGVERLEEHLDHHWGEGAPRTYNKNLSILRDFFQWAVLKGKLHGDPTLPLQRHKARQVHRETFSEDVFERILGAGPDPDNLHRDRCALRLLLHYGIRKGALQNVQLKHFDFQRRRLTVFTKGGKVQPVPIPDPAFWLDLERFSQDTEAEPDHYLLCRQKSLSRGYDRETGLPRNLLYQYRDKPMGAHGLHNWWYRALERAGVVAKGQRSGEKMHQARYTAGQRVLDMTGNLAAAKELLGHSDISTTEGHYAHWDIDRLEETMKLVTGN